MSGHQFLHPILPCEFLDSPEFESSRATIDEKFKVSLRNRSVTEPYIILKINKFIQIAFYKVNYRTKHTRKQREK